MFSKYEEYPASRLAHPPRSEPSTFFFSISQETTKLAPIWQLVLRSLITIFCLFNNSFGNYFDALCLIDVIVDEGKEFHSGFHVSIIRRHFTTCSSIWHKLINPEPERQPPSSSSMKKSIESRGQI